MLRDELELHGCVICTPTKTHFEVAKKMMDHGINDDFVKNLGKTIPKGSSALFVLVKHSTPDKVLPEIEPFKPRVLKTSLSNEQEKRLRTALSSRAAAA